MTAVRLGWDRSNGDDDLDMGLGREVGLVPVRERDARRERDRPLPAQSHRSELAVPTHSRPMEASAVLIQRERQNESFARRSPPLAFAEAEPPRAR